MDNKIIHMSILMHGLDITIGGVSRDEVFMQVAASPKLLADYLFSGVVDVINRGQLGHSVLVVVGAEHGIGAEVAIIYEVVVVFLLEVELGLTQEGRFRDLGVEDEVVVDYAVFVDHPAVTLVSGTY